MANSLHLLPSLSYGIGLSLDVFVRYFVNGLYDIFVFLYAFPQLLLIVIVVTFLISLLSVIHSIPQVFSLNKRIALVSDEIIFLFYSGNCLHHCSFVQLQLFFNHFAFLLSYKRSVNLLKSFHLLKLINFSLVTLLCYLGCLDQLSLSIRVISKQPRKLMWSVCWVFAPVCVHIWN